MPEEKKSTTQEIQELVIEDKYREAFLGLPEEARQAALAGMQEAFRASIAAVLAANPDQYKVGIIDALEAGQLQMAATYLAAHPENFVAAPPVETTSPPPKVAPSGHINEVASLRLGLVEAKKKEKTTPVAASKPPYFPKAFEVRSFRAIEHGIVFPSRCARLAQTVFQNKDPKLVDWLRNFEEKFSVPSRKNMRFFAEQRVEGIRRIAAQKIMRREPLNYNESNAYYHTDHFIEEIAADSERLKEERSFSHLVEYVVVELLNELKTELGIRRVLKSSPEEDIFRGSDIVVETQEGHWFSIDLTMSEQAAKLAEKQARSASRHRVFLPNLTALLIKQNEIEPNERIEAIPIVQPLDRELMREITERYLAGQQAGIADLRFIFKTSARDLGKNPSIEERRLLDQLNAA